MSLTLKEHIEIADKVRDWNAEINKIRKALVIGVSPQELITMCDRLENEVDRTHKELRNKLNLE